jgi:hypothetical protein
MAGLIVIVVFSSFIFYKKGSRGQQEYSRNQYNSQKNNITHKVDKKIISQNNYSSQTKYVVHPPNHKTFTSRQDIHHIDNVKHTDETSSTSTFYHKNNPKQRNNNSNHNRQDHRRGQ